VNGNFNLNLAAPGVGNTGGVTVTATVPDWLRFDWNAAALGEENPSGQATFGLFGGNARQIYLREIY
jgi:MSHA biogenesis protein MshQ